MVLTSNFYNPTGVLRWNLGWASPTFAGAFLATVIPYAWTLGGRWNASSPTRCSRPRTVLSWLLEAAALFLLCKTESRGALVAWVAAALYWHTLDNSPGRWRSLGVRGLVLAGFVWLAGFSSRIEPDYLAGDLSIHNRFRLWKGSLEVFGAGPIRGTGAGSSGRLYRAWFQPLDWSQYYPDPINSYLHIGIEYGAVVLGLLLVLIVFAVLAGSRGTSAVSRAAGAAVLAWATASLFSSLWTESRLWIVPAVSIALAAAWGRRRMISAVAAVGAAVALVAAGKAAGWHLARQAAIVPQFFPGGSARVRVSAPNRGSWPVCHVWLDAKVLGTDSARELRKWLARDGSPRSLVVHVAGPDAAPAPGENDAVILFGRSAERLGHSLNRRYARLVVVAPNAPEDDTLPLPPGAIVIFPEIDQDGNLESLRESSVRDGSAIIAPGVGNDIRADWPSLMDQVAARYGKNPSR